MANKMVLSVVLDANEKGLVSGLKVSKTELKKFSGGADDASKNTEKLTQKTQGTNKALGSLKGVLATVGFGALAADMFKSVSSTQKLQAQLKTITGDFTSAGKELNRLIAFAEKTPFTIDQSVEAFAKLTHLGLNPSEEAMMSYGNTASAMGKDMMQMVEAVADASVGEFERLKEFGIKAKQQGNKVSFTFQGVTKTIGKNSKDIQKYLLDIGNTKFAGAMTDQMQTLGAKASNLGVAMTKMYMAIGDSGAADGAGAAIDYLADGINLATENMPYLIDKFATLAGFFMAGAAIKYAPILFTSMKTKILQYATAAKTAAKATGTMAKAQGALMALYAGWEIGSYLRDEFVEVRVAGLAFVGAMETGFENLSYAFKVATAAIDYAWQSTIDFIYENFAELLDFIASGADMLGMDEYAAQFNKWEQEVRQGISTGSDFETTMKSLNDERDAAIERIDDTIVSLINHEYQQEENKKKTKQVTAVVKSNTKATDKNKEAVVSNKNAVKQLLDELDPMRVATRDLTAKQTLLNKALKAGDISAADYEKATTALNKKFDEQTTKTTKAKESVSEYAKSWEKAVERIDTAISDGWLDLLEGKTTNVFDGILDGFKRMLAEMLHLALTKPIMLNIQQGITSAIGGGMFGAGGSGAMGMLGGGSNIMGMLGGGFGGGLMGLGTGLAGLGMGGFGAGLAGSGAAFASNGLLGGMGASLDFSGALFSGGSVMGGIGAALPVIGMIAGAASLVDSLSGGGLFGTSYKTYDNGVELAYDGGEFEGKNYEKKKRKRSFFRGTKRKTTKSNLPADVVNGMNNYFNGVEDLISSAAAELDISSVKKKLYEYDPEGRRVVENGSKTESIDQYLSNFTASSTLSLKDLSESEAAAAIQGWTQNTANQMVGNVFGSVLDSMAVEGEQLTQTLTRVIAQLNVTTSAFDSINLSLTDLSAIAGVSAVQYADDVTKAAGGTDRLAALVQTYQAAFFTQEELLTTQLASAAAQMNSALDVVGADQTNFRSQFEQASNQGLAADQIVQWLEAGALVAQFDALKEQLISVAGDSAAGLIDQALADSSKIAVDVTPKEEVADPIVEATVSSTETQTTELTTVMDEQTVVMKDLNETSKANHQEQISVLGNIANLLEQQLENAQSMATGSSNEIGRLTGLISDMVEEQRSKDSQWDKWQTPPIIVQGGQL